MTESLEEKVKTTIKGVAGSFALGAITNMALIPLAGHPSRKTYNFAQKVAYKISHNTIGMSQVLLAIFDPTARKVVIGTNLVSLALSAYASLNVQKVTEEGSQQLTGVEKSKGLFHFIKQNYHKIPGYVLDGATFLAKSAAKLPATIARGTYEGVKNIPSAVRKVPSYITRAASSIKRGFPEFATAWSITALAVASHIALPSYSTGKVHHNKVNVEFYDCSLQREKEDHFILLGEMHYYNESSSIVLRRVMESYNIDGFLSEGTGGKEEGLTMKVFFKSVPIIANGLFGNFPDGSDISKEINLPIHPLEKIGENGLREGVGPREQALIGIIGTAAFIYGPFMYFGMLGGEQFDLYNRMVKNKSGSGALGSIAPGLIHARNRHMVENSLPLLPRYELPMIRIGAAHVPGVLEEYAKHADIDCQPIDISHIKF